MGAKIGLPNALLCFFHPSPQVDVSRVREDKTIITWADTTTQMIDLNFTHSQGGGRGKGRRKLQIPK